MMIILKKMCQQKNIGKTMPFISSPENIKTTTLKIYIMCNEINNN